MSQTQQQQTPPQRVQVSPRMSVVFWEVATATHETDPIKSTDETMDESTAQAKNALAEACARRLSAMMEDASRRLQAVDDCCSVRSTGSNSSTRSSVTMVYIPDAQDEDQPTEELELWEVPSGLDNLQ